MSLASLLAFDPGTRNVLVQQLVGYLDFFSMPEENIPFCSAVHKADPGSRQEYAGNKHLSAETRSQALEVL